LDLRIAEICPVGLTKRFCQRRTVWGGQILYLNGGQRHRIVNSFIAHQVQIRQAYMRYLVHSHTFDGAEIMKLFLKEGELPYVLEQIAPILEHARFADTTRAADAAVRKERDARRVEPPMSPRIWSSANWPAWAPIASKDIKSRNKNLDNLVSLVKVRSSIQNSGRESNLGDSKGLILTWSGFVDVLFALSRCWNLNGTWGEISDKFGRSEAMITEFDTQQTDTAEQLQSFLARHFSDDSKIAAANRAHESKKSAPVSQAKVDEAVGHIRPFIAPLKQLMEIYDPEDNLTPGGMAQMMVESKMAKVSADVVTLALECKAGKLCQTGFLAGERTDMMSFGIDVEGFMEILARSAASRCSRKDQKVKMSVKVYTKKFIRDLFNDSKHTLELKGTVIKGLD